MIFSLFDDLPCFYTELLRYALAIALPLLLSLLIGPKLISILRAMKAGQPIREARKGVLAPEHQGKVGTPTMGGVMIIGLVLLTNLLCNDLLEPRLQCCLLVMVVTAGLGFMDDYAKITANSTDGVSGWVKILLQAVAATGCAFYLYHTCPEVTRILVPFYGSVDIGWLFIPLALLVIIGSSNAVNLTDGLDGLASGTMVIACLFFLSCMPYVQLVLHHTGVPLAGNGAPAMSLFLWTMISACLGFLWFNCNPARVFMGDTGSLSLGGALGAVAVCMHMELLLVIIGGVFVAEACSVMIQVFWFKLSRKMYGEGRRFFRMAPIHHHFEKGGWKETQVCVRFWIIAFMLGGFAIASLWVTTFMNLPQ